MPKIARSPWGSNPPYMSLAESLSVAEKLYEHGGGRASKDLFSRLTGNSASSSSFSKKVAALKSFGLLTTPTKDEFVLTDLGNQIAAPTDPDLVDAAKKQSFLTIEIFGRIFDRQKGKLLPADEFLRNIIEQDCGIPRDLSAAWANAFKEGLRTAGLAHERGDGKIQIMESPVSSRNVFVSASMVAPTEVRPVSQEMREGEIQPMMVVPSAGGHSTKIELSDKRFAYFSIPDHLTITDAKRLKAALTGFSSIIDSMVNEDQ